MTRRNPTPEEEALPEKCCFWCHHVMGTWNHNYAPDHFTKPDEYGKACRFTPLIPRKKSHTCDKWITADFFYSRDKYKFKYPWVASYGGVEYAFHTMKEEQIVRKKWLEGLNL